MPELDIDAEDHRTTVQDGLWAGLFGRVLPRAPAARPRGARCLRCVQAPFARRERDRELANGMIGSGPLEAWENEGGAELWLSA